MERRIPVCKAERKVNRRMAGKLGEGTCKWWQKYKKIMKKKPVTFSWQTKSIWQNVGRLSAVHWCDSFSQFLLVLWEIQHTLLLSYASIKCLKVWIHVPKLADVSSEGEVRSSLRESNPWCWVPSREPAALSSSGGRRLVLLQTRQQHLSLAVAFGNVSETSCLYPGSVQCWDFTTWFSNRSTFMVYKVWWNLEERLAGTVRCCQCVEPHIKRLVHRMYCLQWTALGLFAHWSHRCLWMAKKRKIMEKSCHNQVH